ncbi:MAG TPA: OST-HTH/LOTUS domain-containing protein [Steroidobacteraceae bacterium]|nr:OST-HTH/LOTUS domain-containing protein [Steroidobacteraceae bacterium]
MNNGLTDERTRAIGEIHQRIGRNLLRFQEMEVALKVILPYVHPDAAIKGVEAMRQYQKEHVDQKTFGYLLGQFRESTASASAFFAKSSDLIRAARNDLVHHFYQLQGLAFLQPDGLALASDWLDKQFQDSDQWYHFLRVQSLITLLALMESKPELATKFGAYHERLLAQLPPGLEYIDKGNPTRTTWATSRIVRLLQLAELNTERRDGRTLLAHAGRFIQSRSPKIRAEEYGVRTLKDVLLASGMFEVMVEPDGSTITYRSIVQLPDNLAVETAGQMSWTVIKEK